MPIPTNGRLNQASIFVSGNAYADPLLAHSRNWILVLHIYLNSFLSKPHLVRDTKVLAKSFLNVLKAITKSEEKLPILKIRIFDTSQANAFKSDTEKLNSYLSMKGNQEFNDLVNGVVSYLLNEGLISSGISASQRQQKWQ